MVPTTKPDDNPTTPSCPPVLQCQEIARCSARTLSRDSSPDPSRKSSGQGQALPLRFKIPGGDAPMILPKLSTSCFVAGPLSNNFQTLKNDRTLFRYDWFYDIIEALLGFVRTENTKMPIWSIEYPFSSLN